MAKGESPTVFGLKLQEGGPYGGWELAIFEDLVVTVYACGFDSTLYEGAIDHVWFSGKHRKTPQAAARDIERELTRLRKRLERMGA